MTAEDQLTKSERLRLECFAQSVSATTIVSDKRPTLDDIFKNAKIIEEFLKASNPN